MLRENTKIPQLKPRYFRGKLDNHFEKFVEVVRRLSINMSLLDALQFPTYSRYFKDILANNYEIATLGRSCQDIRAMWCRYCKWTREAKRPRMLDDSMFRWFVQV
jgi:hypothetical protein